MGSFERLTKRAKKVLDYAQEEALALKHPYLGTEHLLLGLLHDREGIAGKVLDNVGITLNQARQAIESVVGRGIDGGRRTKLELTASAKKIIEYALDESRHLGHHYIGTEHLLLGLIRKDEGVASGVLELLGVSSEQVREAVLSELGLTTETRAATKREHTFVVTKKQNRTALFLPIAALLTALGYIIRLRRELNAARQRGDMYRDIAASLDQQRTQ